MFRQFPVAEDAATNGYDVLAFFIGCMAFIFVVTLIIVAGTGGIEGIDKLFGTYIPNVIKMQVEVLTSAADILWDKFELMFYTSRVFLTVLMFLMLELIYAWRRERQAAIDAIRAVVDESYVIASPAKEAIVAVFRVFSNPSRLIGYALFICLLRAKPELINDLIKGAEKAQKLG